ncbi:MAG: diaminopimelate epimerase [Acidobacteria bacterium]|nr:diaminopimelate epimerase [Acidobacteriota bacterium]
MTAFFKVSGSGNDFVALAEPAADPGPEQIRAWCRRGISLGADGVFVLRRAAGRGAEAGAGGEAVPEVAMAYWNAGGDAADLCLNGTRCAAQLACHLGWSRSAVRVRTGAGTFLARRLDEARVVLELDVEVGPPRQLTVEVDGLPHAGWHVMVGVPHFVLSWPGDLAAAPAVELGRSLRYHAAFQPAGANVNFVGFDGNRHLHIRTYERGVEDETLSCGTGAVAAAAVGVELGRLAAPVTVATRGGFDLVVDRDPATQHFTLAGDARIVASGELLPGAEEPAEKAPRV